MPLSRYNKRQIIINTNEEYLVSDIFKKRGLNNGTPQFDTPDLSEQDSAVESQIVAVDVVWNVGSKYYNLAKEYYGDEEYWWVIAWYNLTPFEADNSPGDIISIPTPLEAALSKYGVI